MANKKTEDRDNKLGLFVPAELFLGFAYGFMTGNMPAGLFGGLGLGFLAMAVVSLLKK